MPHFELFVSLTARDLRSRFVGSSSGWVWLILNPLLLLAVYGFVFGSIFQARVPPDLDMPFIAWLAVALWPWMMFSEGCLRGAQSIREHAALISKVALPRQMPVLASVTSVFLIHLAGYSAVFIILAFMDIQLWWAGLPRMLLALLALYILTVGLSLALSAVQVFVRDLEQALPTVFMFWFFLTPILYSPELLPSDMGHWLQFNPITWWMAEIRQSMLHGDYMPGWPALLMLAGSLIVTWLGYRLFNRLSPHFEDFL